MVAPRIGTSGYAYKEWKGAFYPEDLPDEKFLAYYAQHFDTVEINYSFYRMPTVRQLQAWAKETPDGFLFTLKAPRRITHDMRLRDAGEAVTHFCEVASALKGKLGVLLFQLPPFLRKDTARLEDFLHQLPEGFRTAFEFRNPTWFDDEVYDCLHRFDVALCVTENEQRDTPCERTATFGYFRLRRPEYTDEDLAAWARRLEELGRGWTDAFVYFKHEDEGRGARLAAKLRALVGSPERVSAEA
ncbi:MAG: hypothetical protein KatS3mg076_2785 [Candidatus Binatia bacterium]|nr:MAG: hypothetical protein KatS3mg076_2785 [Candidatus Binatia bacterium]